MRVFWSRLVLTMRRKESRRYLIIEWRILSFYVQFNNNSLDGRLPFSLLSFRSVVSLCITSLTNNFTQENRKSWSLWAEIADGECRWKPDPREFTYTNFYNRESTLGKLMTSLSVSWFKVWGCDRAWVQKLLFEMWFATRIMYKVNDSWR